MDAYPEPGLRVVTHNICQGGRSGSLNSFQRLLSEINADIICAQETRHPSSYLAGACMDGAHVVHEMVPHGKWGSAILSRRHALTSLPIAEELKGWVVGARVQGVETGDGHGELDVYSIHVPSPGPYERRVTQLLDAFSRIPSDRPRIVAGDFNITVALRQESEALKNTAGELQILARFQNELSLTNAWQALHPGLPLPQTLRWARNRETPYHCDGIFVDHRCMPMLKSASVLGGESWAMLSDHNPVLAVLADKR
jgi:endonuclease/exonuclease/phosphatase family metal-dependent hydrolase